MKFSYSIPVVTVVLLFLTLCINIFGLKMAIEKFFPIYIENTNVHFWEINNLNPDGLRAIASIQTLDNETQEDYQNALNELSNISNSLESLSKNPELYVKNPENPNEQDSQASASAFSISFDQKTLSEFDKQTKTNILQLVSNPLSFNKNSDEGIFLFSIFKYLLVINIIWILGVAIIYTLWIRRIFRPIHLINQKLQQFTKEKQKIEYSRKNEFLPLINTLNSLSESLDIQDKIRNQFLSDLSHEIRTPMTAISCLLEAIDDGVMELDAVSIATLQNEMSRLVKITEHIMSHENFLQSFDGYIEKNTISLQKVTQKIIAQYQPQIAKNTQKIMINFHENAMLLVNEEYYIQILHNIFSNFYKYAGKNTTLTLSMKTTKNEDIIIFADDGNGVPEKDLPFLKEKFYRADIGRNQNENWVSMGIGFSIIDRIMRAHNGTIEIANNQPKWLKISLYFFKSTSWN